MRKIIRNKTTSQYFHSRIWPVDKNIRNDQDTFIDSYFVDNIENATIYEDNDFFEFTITKLRTLLPLNEYEEVDV